LKVEHIDAIPLAIPFTTRGRIPAWRGKDYGTLETTLVRVEATGGLVGWGEAFSYNCQHPVVSAINHMVAPLVIGRDPRQITAILNEAQKVLHIYGRYGIANFALSGVDIALWDIAGKLARSPLEQIIGGTMRPRISAYASLFRYDDPQRTAEEARRMVDSGFRRVKVHARHVADLRAVRDAVGAETAIMLDTNCAWTIAEAYSAAPEIAGCDATWLEEPIFPPEDFATLARFQRDTGIPIATGENACTAFEFHKILLAQAARYIQPSVTKVGGVTEFRKVVALAEVNGVTLAPHSPYFGPGFLATLHLIGAQPNPPFVEYFCLDMEAKPFGAALEPSNGKIALPTGPGLGLDPDAGVISDYRVRRD
jgi:L-alanine-DL-glutamate epimerase-like enolase superfamily enzyme